MPVRRWGGEATVGAGLPGTASLPQVAGLAGGGWATAWLDLTYPTMPTLRVQRYDAFGQPQGSEIVAPSPGSAPALVALPGGGFLLAAEVRPAGEDRDIRAWRYGPDGTALGAIEVDPTRPGDSAAPAVTRAGGDTLVLSQIDGDLVARRYDPEGAWLGETWVTTAPGLQDLGDIAGLAGGGWVATWTDRAFGRLDLRVFGADGRLQGEGTANGTPLGGNPGNAAVAGLAGGGFVVAWETSATPFPGAAPDIRARLFDPSGNPLGVDFAVNATTPGAQRAPEVLGLRDGGFLVAWTDLTGEPSLRAQLYDGFGVRQGREVIVSSSPLPDAAGDIGLTELADGRVVVAWRGLSDAGPVPMQQVIDPRDGIVSGTPGADLLLGHEAAGDEISGFGGADTLWGLRGGDMLYGGAGGDTLMGQRGDDLLFGGGGHDLLLGGAGEDDLFGGAGLDTAVWQGAVTFALDGTLAATGTALGDSLSGIEGLRGSDLADRLRGDALANTLQGGDGADRLEGQAGNDTLLGEGGGDLLAGGFGADWLSGGAGADRFALRALAESPTLAGADRIADFRPGEDYLDLSALDADPALDGRQPFAPDTDGSFSRGEVRQVLGGGDLRIEVNANGDPAPEAVVILLGVRALLAPDDLLL